MDIIAFDALEEAARAAMAKGAYAFVAAGADDEITVRENCDAWRRLRLYPCVLRDISAVDTEATVLGQPVAAPILIAPMGRHRLYHPEGERATAHGAAAADTIFTVPTTATVAVEEIAAARGAAPQWFQLYLSADKSGVESLLDRVVAAGFRAIVLTVDQPVSGYSPRAAREPFTPSPEIRQVNLPGAPMARTAYDAALKGTVTYLATFRDLEWLVRRSPLPVVVKGVLRGDDATRCVDAGARAIIVSNHGGRHLDTAVTTAAALPGVVAAVGEETEVYVDGGIRRGTDILKALALGARAVFVGRPVAWGLAAHGADGVRDVLLHLRAELVRAMALCGAPRISEITRDLVAPADGV